MDKVLPTVLTVVILLIIFGLIGMGWRNRLRRQAGTAPLPSVPAELSLPSLSVTGQYVATTTEGDWLDRLAVHSLGIRTNAVVQVHDEGVLITRSGAPDIFVAADRLDGVRLESGMAGKFVESGGLVVLSWRLGEQPVDTGFRTRAASDTAPLVAALAAMLPAEQDAGQDSAEHKAAGQSAAERRREPGPDRLPDQPGTDQPGTDQPGTDQSSTDQPGADQPSADQLPWDRRQGRTPTNTTPQPHTGENEKND